MPSRETSARVTKAKPGEKSAGLGRRAALSMAFGAFFLSGAAGLIYEVVWSRMLGLVFGNTSHAIATVASVYMLGLGAGAYLIGRISDRLKNGLLLYAILELGIGVYCYFTPALFRGVESAYVAIYPRLGESAAARAAGRLLLCFGVLTVPTLLMGGTLPALSKFFIEHAREFGARVGLLYGINTLGAVVGCAVAGFVLLPALGVEHSILLAVAINCALGIGVACIALRLRGEGEREAAAAATLPKGSILTPHQLWLLMVAFSLSGFASLAYEVSWTRMFCLAMGSSVYAFSAILSAFLLGIGVGSLLYSWLYVPSWSEDVRWFGGMQLAMALSVILLLFPFGLLPLEFGYILDRFHENFFLVVLTQLGVTILLVVIPTAIMGFCFPLVAGLAGPSLRRIGRGVGTIYGVNTIGSVCGSLVAGFLLIPSVGIETTIHIAAFVNLGLGVAIIASHPQARVKNCLAAGIMVVVVAVNAKLVPPWQQTMLSSGVFWASAGGAASAAAAASESGMPGHELVYYKDGLNGTVSVFEARDPDDPTIPTSRWVCINGKPEASLTKVDMYNQLFLGHGPLLLSPNPRKVLLIGLGSGITLGAMSTHPEVQELDCAEIEEAMVEAAEFFKVENRQVLRNPKTKIILNDGRNYLLATKEVYDVIVSEPSNPWMAGIANLYSREFLGLCRKRLSSDGLMCLWFHTYRMSERDMRMIIRTFSETFPNCTMWFAMPSDIFLMGRKDPGQKPSLEVLTRHLASSPEAVKDLASVQILQPTALGTCFLMGPEEIGRFSAGAPVHTDDHPILEFSAPRYMFADTIAGNFAALLEAGPKDPRPFADLNLRPSELADYHYYNALALAFKGSRKGAATEAEKAKGSGR